METVRPCETQTLDNHPAYALAARLGKRLHIEERPDDE